MAFFSVVPEDYRRGGTPTQRQSKRTIMHVDQVVIQADRMVPSNRNTSEMGRIRYQEPGGSIYSNDACLGPPERKRMRRDYSIMSAQPSDEYGSEQSPRFYDVAYNTHLSDRRDTQPHHYSRQPYQPASSWESTDSSFSSIAQSVADNENIEEEERKWANRYREDGSSRGTYASRNQRSPKKRESYVHSQPPYDMSSACSRCCKPESEPRPVEIQIQECPGLPDMRAYVVVPMKRSTTQNPGELDQAARRAARAVPPIMRASRHPQAIVVECNHNRDVSPPARPASTSKRTSATATAPSVSPAPAPPPTSASKSRSRSREPSTVSSLSASRRQDPVDGLANNAVAAVAAATASKPTTPPASTDSFKGQCAVANYPPHGKVTGQKVNTIGSSRFPFLHAASDDTPADDNLNFDSVASSLASMDCCTFISKLPNVLLMMDKASKRFQVAKCFGRTQKTELQL